PKDVAGANLATPKEVDAARPSYINLDDPTTDKPELHVMTQKMADSFVVKSEKKGSFSVGRTPVNFGRARNQKSEKALYILPHKQKIALTAEERCVVTYAMSAPDQREGVQVCQFPEHGTSVFKMHIASMAPGKCFASTIIDAISHMLNREQKSITRLCFSIAVAVRSHIELALNDSYVPYMKNVNWNDITYAFFPIHGGHDFEHFYVWLVDFEKHEKVILNSIPCRNEFLRKPYYKDTGTRLMQYLRDVFIERKGLDIKDFT
ncbi:hypothetical protein LINPERPRIM_LOCUS39230, partial [Linum perenne]